VFRSNLQQASGVQVESVKLAGVPVESVRLAGVPVRSVRLAGVPVESDRLAGVPVEPQLGSLCSGQTCKIITSKLKVSRVNHCCV
jgi:hypothetical protein